MFGDHVELLSMKTDIIKSFIRELVDWKGDDVE
jgi:hypothetical protein